MIVTWCWIRYSPVRERTNFSIFQVRPSKTDATVPTRHFPYFLIKILAVNNVYSNEYPKSEDKTTCTRPEILVGGLDRELCRESGELSIDPTSMPWNKSENHTIGPTVVGKQNPSVYSARWRHCRRTAGSLTPPPPPSSSLHTHPSITQRAVASST